MAKSAEVIKIEHPIRGDDTRSWGPPYAPYKDGRTGAGESAYYLSVRIVFRAHYLFAKSLRFTNMYTLSAIG